MHKEDFHRSVTRNDAYISNVRRVFRLSSTDNIKNENIIKKILGQITLEDVKDAIKRADDIRRIKAQGNRTKIGGRTIYSNHDFSIHEFLKVVLKDSGDF